MSSATVRSRGGPPSRPWAFASSPISHRHIRWAPRWEKRKEKGAYAEVASLGEGPFILPSRTTGSPGTVSYPPMCRIPAECPCRYVGQRFQQ
jgi:hypothetical protein